MSKISVMTPSGALDGTEKLPLVKDGGNVSTTVDDIKTFSKNIVSDHITTNQVLTGVGVQYLALPTLQENSDYVIDGLLTFINTNTDGLRLALNQGVDLALVNVRFFNDGNGYGNISMAEHDITDATGLSFFKIIGFVKTGVGSNDVGIALTNIADIIGTTTLTPGSYLTATLL